MPTATGKRFRFASALVELEAAAAGGSRAVAEDSALAPSIAARRLAGARGGGNAVFARYSPRGAEGLGTALPEAPATGETSSETKGRA